MGNTESTDPRPCLIQHPPPECLRAFECQIVEKDDLVIDDDALEESVSFFLGHFDNPSPIIEEVGLVVEQFGERTVLYIFAGIFVASTIIIWYTVYKRYVTWKAALLVNIIILIVLLLFAVLYRASIRDFLRAEFTVITNSLEKWLDDQIEKIPSTLNDTACFYVQEAIKDE